MVALLQKHNFKYVLVIKIIHFLVSINNISTCCNFAWNIESCRILMGSMLSEHIYGKLTRLIFSHFWAKLNREKCLKLPFFLLHSMLTFNPTKKILHAKF
jgi:hypothetical protein